MRTREVSIDVENRGTRCDHSNYEIIHARPFGLPLSVVLTDYIPAASHYC